MILGRIHVCMYVHDTKTFHNNINYYVDLIVSNSSLQVEY